LWRERKDNDRGTAPIEGPASNADFVSEPVDDGWADYDQPTYTYHGSRDPPIGEAGPGSAPDSGFCPLSLASIAIVLPDDSPNGPLTIRKAPVK
jgi:hypothetical protein